MARHDHQQRICRCACAARAQAASSDASSPLARDGEQQHRPARKRGPPAAPRSTSAGSGASRTLGCRRPARRARRPNAQAAASPVWASTSVERLGRQADQRGIALALACMLFSTGGRWPAPSAHRRLRHRQQVGPDLGFHQHAQRRRNWARKRRTAPACRRAAAWRSPSRSSSRPASRPVAVLGQQQAQPGRRSRSAAISAAAARVSPSDTACTHSQPDEGASA